MPKRRVLAALLYAAVFSIFLSIGVFLRNFVVPIAMYHSVHPGALPENRLEVSVETFDRQMHFLKSRHYNVIPLEELAALIKEKKRIPPRTIALTFDDGYKDTYTYAFPVLKKYNLPATMFIIVNEVGRPAADRLSWDEIKEMRGSGLVTFGSHCLGPEPLVNIKTEEELRNQIFNSKKILEEKLGAEVTAFSYPEGRFNGRIRELVIGAGYKLAVATNPGKAHPDDDIFALKRLRISSTARNLFIFWVETSGFYNFIRENRHK